MIRHHPSGTLDRVRGAVESAVAKVQVMAVAQPLEEAARRAVWDPVYIVQLMDWSIAATIEEEVRQTPREVQTYT